MKVKKEKEVNGKAVSSLLNVFLSINPEIPGGMGNKPQRRALDYLVTKYGQQAVADVVGQLAVTNVQRFMPKVYTPAMLKANWTRWQDQKKIGEQTPGKPVAHVQNRFDGVKGQTV